MPRPIRLRSITDIAEGSCEDENLDKLEQDDVISKTMVYRFRVVDMCIMHHICQCFVLARLEVGPAQESLNKPSFLYLAVPL